MAKTYIQFPLVAVFHSLKPRKQYSSSRSSFIHSRSHKHGRLPCIRAKLIPRRHRCRRQSSQDREEGASMASTEGHQDLDYAFRLHNLRTPFLSHASLPLSHLLIAPAHFMRKRKRPLSLTNHINAQSNPRNLSQPPPVSCLSSDFVRCMASWVSGCTILYD